MADMKQMWQPEIKKRSWYKSGMSLLAFVTTSFYCETD